MRSKGMPMTTRPRTAALLLAAALLAGLAGAGAFGRPADATDLPASAGEYHADRWRGGFWRPAGSVAERPALRLEQTTFTPEAKPRHPEPGTLASLRAVAQLALLD
jgi:hypothetical protein